MKVLKDMLPASTGATYSKSQPKRVLLDLHQWDNYELTLFYEGKKLCLQLTEGDEHQELGQWTFCSDARHLDRVESTDGHLIDVAYRPAHIAISFSAATKGGFLKRMIHSMDRVYWSEYQLRPDGLVSVTRPGEEIVVG